MAKPLRPGTPPDMGTLTASEIAAAEQARREARDRDEALRARGINPEDVPLPVEPTDPRLAYRDDGIEESRGGRDRGSTFDNEDWHRASMPTDPERRRQLRAVFDDSVLPNLPHKPGFHRVWISTTHESDTPRRRMRLGYYFVTEEDAKKEGWQSDELAVLDASSSYKGFLMWREMIAMETTWANYVSIMRELHHDAPMDAARGIADGLDGAAEQARHRGGRVTLSPGMEDLRQYTRPPRQFE